MVLVAGAVIPFFTARLTSNPVGEITSAMGNLAEGTLETDILALNRGGEVGEMAHAF